MKWSKSELLQARNGTIVFEDTIEFEPAVFDNMHQIKGLQKGRVSGTMHYEETNDRVYADLNIDGVMILPCSITLEEIEYAFHINSLEVFAFDKTEDEDMHVVNDDVIHLLPVIFQLILLEIPLKVVKEGLTQYPKGDGWEVVKEEAYMQTKQRKVDLRFAKLKEYKLED